MVPDVSPRRALSASAAVAGAVLLLVALRIEGQPIQPYGDNGAAWIEHTQRVELLDLAAANDFGPAQLLRAWDDHIVSHPVGLHLTGAISGPRAESVLWMGPLWLLLLACGTAGVAWGATRRRDAAVASATFTLLVPALHATATRYHYDLPMTALLWAGVGLLAAKGSDRPVLAGLGAGLLLGFAGWVKWTAIPFALPMLLGVLLLKGPPNRRNHATACLLGGVLAAIVTGTYIGIAPTSFGATALALGDEGGRGPVGALIAGLGSQTGPRLSWYPLALLFTVLSPLYALALVGPILRWVEMRGPAGRFLFLTVLGQLAFLLLAVDRPDDRFLLTLAPTVTLAAGLGWAYGSARMRRVVGVGTLAVGLLVGLDAHVGGAAAWNAERVVLGEGDRHPRLAVRGLGMADSFEQRGWARRDSTAPADADLREALWEAIARCGSGDVGYRWGVSERGDAWWLRYRAGVAAYEGTPLRTPLRVLTPMRVGGQSFWWVDPDGVPEPSVYDHVGFSPDDEAFWNVPEAKTDAVPHAAATLFSPDVVIDRVGERPSELLRGWRIVDQWEGSDFVLGLYAPPGGCGSSTN